MGNLVTYGKASKKYDAEIMRLSIVFRKEGNDVGYIIRDVQSVCEDFLAELEKIKIPPEKVILNDDDVSKDYNSEKLRAERGIIIRTPVDIRLCTYIFSIIKKFKDQIKYSISFDVINQEELQDEVLRLAVEDSRRQAETIAASLGKSIIGVNSVNDQERRYRNLAKSVAVDDMPNPKIPDSFDSDTPLADRTSLPSVSLEEEITICWNMSE